MILMLLKVVLFCLEKVTSCFMKSKKTCKWTIEMSWKSYPNCCNIRDLLTQSTIHSVRKRFHFHNQSIHSHYNPESAFTKPQKRDGYRHGAIFRYAGMHPTCHRDIGQYKCKLPLNGLGSCVTHFTRIPGTFTKSQEPPSRRTELLLASKLVPLAVIVASQLCHVTITNAWICIAFHTSRSPCAFYCPVFAGARVHFVVV